MKMGWKLSITAAATLLAACTAVAQPRHGPGPGRHPPKEALDACTSLKVGDACSFTLDGRTLQGSCRGPQDKPPACAPNDLPPPPKEALAACASLRNGDACAFDFDGRSLRGTCRGPPDRPPACAPNDLPPPGAHRGPPPPPPAALDACKNLRDGDSCAFSIDGHDVRGSCRDGPNGRPAACRPSDLPRRP